MAMAAQEQTISDAIQEWTGRSKPISMRCSGSPGRPFRTWPPGASIINTASITAFDPSKQLLDYSAT
jgi:hypothetical protein